MPENNPSFGIFNGLVPLGAGKEFAMPKVMPFVFDMSTGEFLLDIAREREGGIIDTVQSMFVDNFANTAALNIECSITRYRVVVPAFGQGFYPLIFTPGSVLTFTTPQAPIYVRCLLFNVPLPAAQW